MDGRDAVGYILSCHAAFFRLNLSTGILKKKWKRLEYRSFTNNGGKFVILGCLQYVAGIFGKPSIFLNLGGVSMGRRAIIRRNHSEFWVNGRHYCPINSSFGWASPEGLSWQMWSPVFSRSKLLLKPFSMIHHWNNSWRRHRNGFIGTLYLPCLSISSELFFLISHPPNAN